MRYCTTHDQEALQPCPDGFEVCRFFIPELGASEDYGCIIVTRRQRARDEATYPPDGRVVNGVSYRSTFGRRAALRQTVMSDDPEV